MSISCLDLLILSFLRVAGDSGQVERAVPETWQVSTQNCVVRKWSRYGLAVSCVLEVILIKWSELVSWCFEPSQQPRITSGLNTNFNLSPSYSFHKSIYHESFVLKRRIRNLRDIDTQCCHILLMNLYYEYWPSVSCVLQVILVKRNQPYQKPQRFLHNVLSHRLIKSWVRVLPLLTNVSVVRVAGDSGQVEPAVPETSEISAQCSFSQIDQESSPSTSSVD